MKTKLKIIKTDYLTGEAKKKPKNLNDCFPKVGFYSITESQLFGDDAVDLFVHLPKFSMHFALATLAKPDESPDHPPMRLRQFCFTDRTTAKPGQVDEYFLTNERNKKYHEVNLDHQWNMAVTGVRYDPETKKFISNVQNADGDIVPCELEDYMVASMAYLNLPDGIKNNDGKTIEYFKSLKDGAMAPMHIFAGHDGVNITSRVSTYDREAF